MREAMGREVGGSAVEGVGVGVDCFLSPSPTDSSSPAVEDGPVGTVQHDAMTGDDDQETKREKDRGGKRESL